MQVKKNGKKIKEKYLNKARYNNMNGITLVSLVVTIIVMIILAGVSITLILSDNSIFQKAKETKIIQSKGEIYEDLILKKGNVMDDSMNIKLEDYMNHIEEPGIKVAGRNVTAIENGENENTKIVTIDNKYVYSIEQKENDIVINEIGYVHKLEPIIRYFKIEEETTSSVTVKIITKMAKKYELYIAEEGQEYEKVKEISKTLENYNDQEEIYTYSKLTQGTKYKFKIIVKNDIGQKEQEIEQELGKVPDITLADITVKIEPNGWTNQDVTATVSVKEGVNTTGFTLQTSKNGTNWDSKASQTYSANGTIYVRLIDSTGQEGAGTSKAIENIDKTAPTVTSATPTTNTVTVVGADEGGSNVTGYALTTSTATPALSSFQESGTFTEKAQGTTYYAWVRDGAGNISAYREVGTTSVTDLTTADITVTLSPNGWTNQDVTATVSVNSGVNTTGFTLQTSKNGTTWDNTASQTYSANGTIYARLIDSTKQEGASTSKAIENIDKTPPGKTTVNLNGYTSGSWTNGDVTQTFSATDTGGSEIAKYQYSHDKVNIGADLTSSWTINWDGQWTFYIRAVDNAGNAGAWSDAYIVRRSTGTPSVPTITYNGGSNSCSWKNNYNLTLSSSATSGISYYEVDWNSDGGVDTTTGSNFIPWNGYSSCTTRFRTVDNAGNRSGWTDNHHIHMDTQAPTISNLSGNFSIVSGNTGTITGSITDSGGSGVRGYYVSTSSTTPTKTSVTWISGSSISKPVTSAGTYYVWAIDNAGTVSDRSSCTVSVQTAVAQIGTTYYSSIQNAVNAQTTSTVNLLVNRTEGITIPSGKNITLNLNGKTLSYSDSSLGITNNGILQISNGTVIKTDYSQDSTIFVNYGTLNISSGTYTHNSSSSTDIWMSVLWTAPSGTTTITGGTLTTVKGGAAICNNGTTTVSGGNIRGGHGICSANNLTVTGGTIIGDSWHAIDTSGGTVVVNGSSVNLTGNYYGVSLYGTGTLNVLAGTITGNITGIGITGTATSNVLGGTITGNTYDGIYLENGATANIGNANTVISAASPILIGKNYGVANEKGGTANFYNGSLKGTRAGYLGTVTPRSGYILSGTTSNGYYVTTLVQNVLKGQKILDYGTIKNWCVIAVSGNNIKIVSQNNVGSWLETSEAPDTEVSKINSACTSYTVNNSAGTIRTTCSGNLTLADINSYDGASYSLTKIVSGSIFKSGTFWLATNCTERYGGPYYINEGTVKYAHYKDKYIDNFSLRPVATISKSYLHWDPVNQYWKVI